MGISGYFVTLWKHLASNALSVAYLQDNDDLGQQLLFTVTRSHRAVSITLKQASIMLTFALFRRH